MKMRVEGNELQRIVLLDKELPTLATPWSQLDPFFRQFVLPKLDISKKWTGCWMWTGATIKGEPRMTVRDSHTRKKGRLGQQQSFFVKHRMARAFIDTRKVPRRLYSGSPIDAPDIDVVHICENLSCLNPAHWVVCCNDAKHRDVQELRDKYLAPGTYYVG